MPLPRSASASKIACRGNGFLIDDMSWTVAALDLLSAAAALTVRFTRRAPSGSPPPGPRTAPLPRPA